VNLRATLDTLKIIVKMDTQVPRKAKKLVKYRNRKGKRKVSFKEDGLPCKRKHSFKYCASVQSTAEPKQLTILGIVENIRKTGSLKRILNPRRGAKISFFPQPLL
jgi:hypothetical protein